jgi:predicted ATPase/class 3 adenylate cyclase
MMTSVRPDRPSGTVTFLVTDVEGSTRLLHELGAEAYAEALVQHRTVIRDACASHGGVEVDTQGDAFFFAFPTAPGALAAAGAMTEALAPGPISVRIGVHTGTPLLTEEGYVGSDVHRAARIAAAGHGGQVLVSSSTAQLVDLELRDLGEHRFKDLTAPERVYQLCEGDFPPLKSLYRTNLPVPATPFLGRERELAEVVELVTRSDLRLLTLTGPGGTGKTRLALQAAAEASESFPDGIYWVPLAPLRDPELVLSSLAQTLAVKAEPDRPLADTLSAYLASKRLLLLLDNVEHLLPQAAAPIATLRDANGSFLLVTSRERLRIGGEQTWPVPPLAEEDGAALFLARARTVDPSFAKTPAVEELCVRLDQLPLAIELAAARTAVFSAEQLLERLSQRLDLLSGDRDADPRQQTLRATIDWSYGLLSAEEQRLFARLAVFVGGCTYEAAEKLAGAEPDTLQSLLDKSLLRKRDSDSGPRYWMLETIREFAAERLRERPEYETVCDRHADFIFALAERAKPELESLAEKPNQVAWLERLETEVDNIRAALDWAQATGRAEDALRAAMNLRIFWIARIPADEARRRFEALLSADLPPALRADGLIGLIQAAARVGDYDHAWALAEERYELYRSLNDDVGMHRVMQNFASIAAERGDLKQARALIEPVVAWARGVSDWELTYPLDTLFDVEFLEGNYDEALAVATEELTIYERGGDAVGIALACGNCGLAHLYKGDLEGALPRLRESFRLWCDIGGVAVMIGVAQTIALVASMRGDARQAALLLGSVDRALDEIGEQRIASPDSPYERAARTAANALGPGGFEAAYGEGYALLLDDAIELARAVLDDD